MAQFYRDEQLSNLTIDENILKQLYDVFQARHSLMPEQIRHTDTTPENFLFSIIRFDNKGHRVFTLPELLNYFRRAKYVERVILTLESGDSISSNRKIGSYMEIRFDEKSPNTCFLAVTSDNSDWVDSSFSAVMEVLIKCKNMNHWAQTIWTQLTIQIAGVFAGFLLSLWAAVTISPHLTIENAFIISFLFALLIFSNLWTYINQRLLSLVQTVFPNIKFYRQEKDSMHWLLQAIVVAIIGAVVLFLLNLVLTYVGRVAGAFIKRGV